MSLSDGHVWYADAVDSIYLAASDPVRWPDALQAVTNVFGDVGTALVYQRRDGSMGTIISPGLKASQEDYEANWSRRDIRMSRAIEKGFQQSRDTITDRHIASERELAEHPFYSEFLAGHGLKWFAGTMISPDPRVAVATSLQRLATNPPFSDGELATFGKLSRHIESALRLGIRRINGEIGETSLGKVLDRLELGVFRLDREGRILFANSVARGLLGGPFHVSNDHLTATAERERRALNAAVAAAVERRDCPSVAEDVRLILLPDAAAERYFAVYVLPVRASESHFDGAFSETRAVVLVIGSNTTEPDPALVRDLLGLTLGEARVASLVTIGVAPRDAAERLGISEETARTVLKRVFAKTGISRQSELAGLLSRLALPTRV